MYFENNCICRGNYNSLNQYSGFLKWKAADRKNNQFPKDKERVEPYIEDFNHQVFDVNNISSSVEYSLLPEVSE